MRLVIMLIALLLVGLLVYKQIGPATVQPPEAVQEDTGSNPPRVPTNPGEVKQFGSQMDEFMKQEADKRAAAIDDATSQ